MPGQFTTGDNPFQRVIVGSESHANRHHFKMTFEPKPADVLQCDILFEPADMHGLCVHVGGDEENTCHQWKGETWIDAEDYQPVKIETQLAKKIPRAVQVLTGINVRQYGFSINYERVAERFPVSYGTEYGLTVFWGYKRKIALAMENNDFRKTGASSIIHYDLPQE